MAIIKIIGTKQGEEIGLAQIKDGVRTPIGGEITGYPYAFNYKVGEYQGQATKSLQMQISHNGASHLFDLGFSSTAKSIIDSFNSVVDPVKDEEFSFSFYTNKRGYASVTIKRISNDTRLEWSMTTEDRAALIERTTKKDGTVIVDSFLYDEKIKAMCEELAVRFPKGTSQSSSGGNALDTLSTEESKNPTSSEDPKTTPVDVNDLPF